MAMRSRAVFFAATPLLLLLPLLGRHQCWLNVWHHPSLADDCVLHVTIDALLLLVLLLLLMQLTSAPWYMAMRLLAVCRCAMLLLLLLPCLDRHQSRLYVWHYSSLADDRVLQQP
jgi:hypothetical protein